MESVSPVVMVAGLISGAILGATLRTETEWKARHGAPGWQPFGTTSVIRIALNQLFWLAITLVVFGAVCVAILRIGNAYPLSNFDSKLLGGTWLLGVAIAKFVRYLYWRRRL
jgi:hypothetical protein